MIKAVLIFFFLGLSQIRSHSLYLITKNIECTKLEDCSHVHELIKTKRNSYGVTVLLNLLHCSDSRRQIYVKCIEASKVEDFIQRADLIPDYDNCGLEGLLSKISGGNKTAIGDYPWIGLLKYNTLDGKTGYGCHGSLISSRYILTAAHCLHPEELRRKNFKNVYSVVLGEYDITTNRDCIASECVENQTKELLVETFDMHPEYNRNTFANDIALIRMEREVEYTDYIKPICLPPRNLISPFNEPLWIAGWGSTDENVMNKIKVKAIFQLNEPDSCVASNLKVSSRQFCARSTHSAKTCPGDSGGPLMRRIISNEIARLFLIGVDSLGIDCRSFTRHFAIYTKVSPYVEWILTTIYK